MFGKLSTPEIEALINRQLIGRIGCHADDLTYVVPISYAYDGTYIYAHSFEGMKVQMMRKNTNVCFEVDDTTNLSNWQSVIAWGTYEELPEGPARNEAIRLLQSRILPMLSSETMHLGEQWPFTSDSDKEGELKGIIFRIGLINKTGRFEKQGEKFFYAS